MRPLFLYNIPTYVWSGACAMLAGKGLKMPSKPNRSKAGLGRFKPRRQSITQHDLRKAADTIMSKISEFSERQKAFNERQDTAIAGVVEDVKALNDKITELQNTPGEITAEDQALLDDIEARNKVVAEKLEALDAQNPPKPPA